MGAGLWQVVATKGMGRAGGRGGEGKLVGGNGVGATGGQQEARAQRGVNHHDSWHWYSH